MFRLESPQYLYLLLLVPVLIVIYFIIRARYRARVANFAQLETFKILTPEASWFKVKLKYSLLVISVALLSIALARPQIGSKLKEIKKKGAEIMFVIDVSNSMLAEDIAPSRIEKTKHALSSLTTTLSEDRIGIVVFAQDAFVQLPITSDFVSANNFIQYISPSMVSAQGTDIGKALSLASRSFSSQSDKSRAIVLISDGEDHQKQALSIAKKLGEKDIKVHVIGVGSPDGVPITIDGATIKDQDGNMVVSKLDEQMLSEIALASGGSYIRATNHSIGLDQIVSQIRKLDAQEFSSTAFEEYNEQFPYILLLIIVILVLEFVILERKNRFIAGLTLFNKESK